MAKTDNDVNGMRKPRRRIFDKNGFVLLFSLIIAIILWFGVSMFQTVPVTKQFNNIKVLLNYEGSAAANNGMKIVGNQDYYIDVTVRGKSYLVNADSFSNKISASVSFDNVTAPGQYSLNVDVSVANSEAEIVAPVKPTILVNIDQIVEKEFPLLDEIIELEHYNLPEGYTRESPVLSKERITLQGPAMEINRVSEVRAVVELNQEITHTDDYTAEIKIISSTDNANISNVECIDAEQPVFITIPIKYDAAVNPVVKFTNAPAYYTENEVPYTISPASLTMTVETGDGQQESDKGVTVGEIDFSRLDNVKNVIRIPAAEDAYPFNEEVKQFTVTVDMSAMHKRWLQIDVSTDGIKLPENARILETTVMSIQLIGPAASVDKIDNSEAYAVPQLADVTLQKGVNEVPVKIYLKTLTDSWIRGEYIVHIQLD